MIPRVHRVWQWLQAPLARKNNPLACIVTDGLTPKALLIASIWSSCHLKATLKIPYKLQIFRGPNVNPCARIKPKLKIWQLVQKCEPFKLTDTTTSLKNVQIFQKTQPTKAQWRNKLSVCTTVCPTDPCSRKIRQRKYQVQMLSLQLLSTFKEKTTQFSTNFLGN